MSAKSRMNRLSKLIGQLQASQSAMDKAECSKMNLKYTVASNVLTDEQRQFYEENGFVVIKKLLSYSIHIHPSASVHTTYLRKYIAESEVSTYYNRFDELVANPKDGPSTLIVMRDVSLKGLNRADRKSEGVVTKLQMWAYDRVLWQYAKNKKLVSYLEDIIGHDIRAHHFMSINKPSDPGQLSSRHPFHQDQWYFPFGLCFCKIYEMMSTVCVCVFSTESAYCLLMDCIAKNQSKQWMLGCNSWNT